MKVYIVPRGRHCPILWYIVGQHNIIKKNRNPLVCITNPTLFVQLIGPQFIMAIQASLESRWESCVEEAWLRLFKCMAYVMKGAMIDNA